MNHTVIGVDCGALWQLVFTYFIGVMRLTAGHIHGVIHRPNYSILMNLLLDVYRGVPRSCRRRGKFSREPKVPLTKT